MRRTGHCPDSGYCLYKAKQEALVVVLAHYGAEAHEVGKDADYQMAWKVGTTYELVDCLSSFHCMD